MVNQNVIHYQRKKQKNKTIHSLTLSILTLQDKVFSIKFYMSRKLFSMGISISITFSKTSHNIHQSQYIVPHKGNRPYLNTWTSLSIIPHPVMNWTLSVLPPQSWIKTNEGAPAMQPCIHQGTEGHVHPPSLLSFSLQKQLLPRYR